MLTPERAIEPGYVVIQDHTIKEVTDKRPDSVGVHDTNGVICPGLIDLHGHPEFNVFAAWEPPKLFVDRYAWRDSELYKKLVRDPQNRLLDALPAWTQLRYAEVRALVGGVTAIQGTGGQARSYAEEALVRNVDKWIFGRQVGRSMIDLPSGSRGSVAARAAVRLRGVKARAAPRARALRAVRARPPGGSLTTGSESPRKRVRVRHRGAHLEGISKEPSSAAGISPRPAL